MYAVSFIPIPKSDYKSQGMLDIAARLAYKHASYIYHAGRRKGEHAWLPGTGMINRIAREGCVLMLDNHVEVKCFLEDMAEIYGDPHKYFFVKINEL